MGKQPSSQRSRSSRTAADPTDPARNASRRNVTPPKGRPTRARSGSGRRQRAFGPVAQWVTVGLLVVLVVVVIVLVTDGGDFNPFDEDQQLPSEFGAPALTVVPPA
jgi:hypothetical protein